MRENRTYGLMREGRPSDLLSTLPSPIFHLLSSFVQLQPNYLQRILKIIYLVYISFHLLFQPL